MPFTKHALDYHLGPPAGKLGIALTNHANQVNNLLGFPGIFRGALDVRATAINESMMLAATRAIADLAKAAPSAAVRAIYPSESLTFGRQCLIPKPFDHRVTRDVATAVARAAMESGVAREALDLDDYREQLERRLIAGSAVSRAVPRTSLADDGDAA